jgi:hypothetical protein
MRTNTAKGSHEVANRDLGKVEIDCRKAAPKEEQNWEICESNERERTSQKLKAEVEKQKAEK